MATPARKGLVGVKSMEKFLKLCKDAEIQRGVLEEYKSLEGSKEDILKNMRLLAKRGWRIQSFGWSNGFQGGWYALMVRNAF